MTATPLRSAAVVALLVLCAYPVASRAQQGSARQDAVFEEVIRQFRGRDIRSLPPAQLNTVLAQAASAISTDTRRAALLNSHRVSMDWNLKGSYEVLGEWLQASGEIGRKGVALGLENDFAEFSLKATYDRTLSGSFSTGVTIPARGLKVEGIVGCDTAYRTDRDFRAALAMDSRNVPSFGFTMRIMDAVVAREIKAQKVAPVTNVLQAAKAAAAKLRELVSPPVLEAMTRYETVTINKGVKLTRTVAAAGGGKAKISIVFVEKERLKRGQRAGQGVKYYEVSFGGTVEVELAKGKGSLSFSFTYSTDPDLKVDPAKRRLAEMLRSRGADALLKQAAHKLQRVRPLTPIRATPARVTPIRVWKPAYRPPRVRRDPPVVQRKPTAVAARRTTFSTGFGKVREVPARVSRVTATRQIQKKVGAKLTQAVQRQTQTQQQFVQNRQPKQKRINLTLGPALSQLQYTAAKSKQAVRAPMPEIAATVAREAFTNYKARKEPARRIVVVAPKTGTRFFKGKAAPQSMGDVTQHAAVAVSPQPVRTPLPAKPKQDESPPKGVKILIDEDMLARVLEEQGEQASLAEIEALEDDLIQAADEEQAYRRLQQYTEAKKAAFLKATRKFQDLDRVRMVSLKVLQSRLAPYRNRWKDRPKDLRTLGGLTRIHGFLRNEAAGDLLLVGRVEPGVKPILVDDLVVGLRCVWQAGLTPGCSLDPDASNLTGRRYSRIINVPKDSSFAMVMLDADYMMKRIMLKAKGEEMNIPGYRSMVDCFFDDPGDSLPHSAFWLFPVQPTSREVRLGPRGSSALFDARVQVLTQELVASGRAMVGTGTASKHGAKAARSFTQHYGQIAEKRPIFKRLQSLFDIVLLARILRLISPEDELLSSLAALPHEPLAVPKTYAFVSVTHSAGQGAITVGGGCHIRMRAGARTMIEVQSQPHDAMTQALSRGDKGKMIYDLANLPEALPQASAVSGAADEQAFKTGIRELAKRRFAKAQDAFSRAIALNESFAAAYSHRAAARFRLGRVQEAIWDAAMAVRLNPSDVTLRVVYRQILLEAGVDEPLKGIDEATRTELANQYSALAAAANAGRDYGAAVEASSRAIEIDPKNAIAYTQRATARLLQRDLSAAEADAGRAVKLAPDDLPALVVRAAVRMLRGNHRGAAADMDTAVKIMPKAYFIGLRGLYRMLAGDMTGAAADAERAVALDPQSRPTVMMAMAIQMCAQIGPQKLPELIKPLLKLPPEVMTAFSGAMAAVQADHPAQALRALEHAAALLDRHADDPAVKEASILREQIDLLLMIQLAKSASGANKAAVAARVRTIQQAMLKRHPDWVSPLFNGMVAFYRLGDFAGALGAADAALRCDPARDPLLGPALATGKDNFEKTILLLKLDILMLDILKSRPQQIPQNTQKLLAVCDRLAVLMKGSAALPACAGLRAYFTTLMKQPGAKKIPPQLHQDLRRYAEQILSAKAPALPPPDAMLAVMFCGIVTAMEVQEGTMENAEKLAKGLFTLKADDEFSPLVDGIAHVRGNACMQLFVMYWKRVLREPRVKLFFLNTPEAMLDPAVAEPLFQKITAPWLARASGRIGEPGLDYMLIEATRDWVWSQIIQNSTLLVNRRRQLAGTLTDPAAAADNQAKLVTATRRLEEIRRLDLAGIRRTVAGAYGEAKTLVEIRTLDRVMEISTRATPAKAAHYRPPQEAQDKVFRKKLESMVRRLRSSKPDK